MLWGSPRACSTPTPMPTPWWERSASSAASSAWRTEPFQSTYYTASASQPVKIGLADVTGDARPDAIVEDSGNVRVYAGSGNPWFEPGTLTIANNSTLAAVGDIDQNGTTDIVTWSIPSHVFVLYAGDGHGNFLVPRSLDATPGAGAVSFVDIDGDGILDMIVQRPSIRAISIAYGVGGGYFGPQEEGIGMEEDARPVVSDFTGDGRPDLFLIGSDFLRVLPQNAAQVA